MKRIYRKLIRIVLSMPSYIDSKKTLLFEIISILKKRHLYKNIHWTVEQQKEFDDYWKKVYGKKISNRWHKLYQSINGVFRVDYFPEILYSTKVEPKINSYLSCKILSDKNLLGTLFSNKIEGVRVPYTYISCHDNLMFDKTGEQISFEDAVKILWDLGEAVIKPTVDSSSGSDVRVVDLKNGIDTITGESVEKLFGKYKTDFVVQERIIAHSSLKKLYPSAINTIRAISYRANGKMNMAPLSLRLGSGGSNVDNIHAGGMVVGLSLDGSCKKKAYALGNCDNKDTYETHPNTGVVFEGYKIPFVEKICHASKELHKLLTNVNMVSWDLTINDNNEIIIIEANCWGQSVWFPQIVNESGFFGDDTKYILESIKK